jgi:hypothetical protein
VPHLLSRHLTTALLWLAIALLPLRGWASVLMPLSMGEAAVAGASTDPAAPAAMPCHGDPQAAEDNAPTAGTCSMCDLCHSNVVHVSQPLTLPSAPQEPLPVADAPQPIEPRAPDGLFRPPRTDLA